MKVEQPSLFEARGNPLEERVGKAFFEGLPHAPGVYLMYGESGKVLYVGKSKNLRKRLFTYRRARADNGRAKVRKLVRMAYRIEIICCEDEQAALLKENALIRQHRPDFNGAKKSPETYYFITLCPGETAWHFRLAMSLPEDETLVSCSYGCFKGHRTVRRGSGALLRLLYLLERGAETMFDFPSALTSNLTPMAYRLPLATNQLDGLPVGSFLNGVSLELIKQMVSVVSQRGLLGTFLGRLILSDLEALRSLYEQCLRRNQQIKQALGITGRLIPQLKLDDYIIRAAFAGQ